MRLPRVRASRVVRAALAATTAASTALAQSSQASVELGAARLTQRDLPRVDAATVGVALRHDGSRFTVGAGGAATLADDGRSTTQGLFAASLLGRGGGRARWEIGGALTAFDQGAMKASKGAYLIAREHLAVGPYRAWVGISVGGVEDYGQWSPTRTAEFGSWYGGRFGRLGAAASLVDTRSEPYGPPGQVVTDPVTYTDGSVGGRWLISRRAEVDARVGLRLISRGALTPTGRGTRPFAVMDAAFWMTPRVAVVAAIGRQLSDLSRGTPDTRFASVALRFSTRDPVAARPSRRPPDLGRPRLFVLGDTTGQSRLVVTVPGGSLVELSASFTGWEPVPLVPRGDRWELARAIPAGPHRVLVRIDGGPWLVPGNLPAAADDFGGVVGIITIP